MYYDQAAADERPPWAIRQWRRFRPREGWLVFALTWVMILCLPAAVSGGELISGLTPAYWLMTLSLALSWWFAHRRSSGLLAAPIILLAGCLADLVWGVNVLNLTPLAWQLAARAAWWLTCGVRTACQVPAPAITYAAQQLAALAEFWQRLGWWVSGVLSGQGVPDNLVLVGLVCLLGWGLAAWAGWWVSGHGRPFVAMLPISVLLAQAIYSMDGQFGYLLAFLGCMPMLFAMARFYSLEQSWAKAGTDYSGELRLDTGLVALAATLLVLVLSPTLPFITSQDLSRLFWRRFEEPYRQIEQRVDRSLPGVQGKKSLVPPLGVAEGGLPRAHLLGGRPELGKEIALRIQVRGVHEGEVLRWRGQTFAIYTGRGWQNDESLQPHGQIAYTVQNLKAGEPWSETQPAGRHAVLSSVQVIGASRSALYSAGEPVSVDEAYRAFLRAPGELAALEGAGLPARYTVLGAVSDQDAQALRSAATIYPPEIKELYLALPDTVPAEVRSLASQLAQNASTPYDVALKIEAYLRKIPYSLDVPTPPAGRELVSWFLFDLKRGYCDYFATAMVVLARSAGIPARLAVGYAQGSYDPRSATYTVSELQAHSWPEIYFPAYGWVPFEPTSAEQTPVRINLDVPAGHYTPPYGPPNMSSGLSELRQLADQRAQQATLSGRLQALLVAVNLVVLAWAVWCWHWRRPAGRPAQGPPAWYDELSRWGARLGRPQQVSETPREYGAALAALAASAALAARNGAQAGRPGRNGAGRAAALVGEQAPQLAEAFESALFAPQEARALGPAAANESRRWQPLWAALRRLWLAMRLHV